MQNQLGKVACQLLGRHGKALHKVQADQCPKGRNKAGITKQFAKEGVAQPQTSFAKAQLKNKCSKVSNRPGQKEQSRLIWRRVQELKYSKKEVTKPECRQAEEILVYITLIHCLNSGPKFILCNTRSRKFQFTLSNAFSWSRLIIARGRFLELQYSIRSLTRFRFEK